MELMGGWEPGVIKDLTPDKKDMADLGYFAFPTMDGGEGDPTAIMGGSDGMAVGEWAPEEAVDFLNFVSEKEWQEKYAEAFSTIPANKEAQDVVTNEALKQELTVYDDASSVSMGSTPCSVRTSARTHRAGHMMAAKFRPRHRQGC